MAKHADTVILYSRLKRYSHVDGQKLSENDTRIAIN